MSAMLQYINQLGPSVVLPVIIFVLGLVLGLSAGRAFRAGVLIGVGFIGINLVIGLLGNSIGPAARQMVEHTGVQLTYLDVGWPSTAAIAFGASVGALAIPVGLVVNIGMLLLRLTKTLDIDLWNYWHIAFAGGIVAILTGNFALGVLGEVIAMVLILVLADWSQPWVRRYFGYDTISFPHGTSTPYFVIALGLEWIFERIPGFRQWDASPEALQRRFGVFGDSMVLGLVFGLLVGIIAGLPWTQILTLGMSVAAVMIILPRMVAILMEGLLPVADAATTFLQKRFPGRELYIGMDTALLVGAPATIAASVVLVPLTLGLAFVLPGNRTLPFIDLATIPFIVALMTPVFRGNVVRTIVGGLLAMIPTLYIATLLGDNMTIAARNVGFAFPANATQITSLVDGGNLIPFLVHLAGGTQWVGLIILLILALALAYLVQRPRMEELMERWAGVGEQPSAEPAPSAS
ncbi:PTS galactitol transporter subunit IIC [Kallotenue papyrolyticum]|uniref:PTS galactitol transporter subunit IIC n=1 Tax=Kallotenue papyrolyticum TaxID=1325125 RepID=UPI000492CC90|nr:PTS transporter subunit IIC [Kallotenue papyrolyticum]